MRAFFLLSSSFYVTRSCSGVRICYRTMSSMQASSLQMRGAHEYQRRGRPDRVRGNGNWRRKNEQSQNTANDPEGTSRGGSESKPKLTHFIAIPLGHSPAVRSVAGSFKASLLARNPPIGGLDPSIIVSSRRLHLTLGVMSLVEEIPAREYFDGRKQESSSNTVSAAISLLRRLRPEILEALDGHPLRVPLSSIDKLKPDRNNPARAHVLFTGPSDDDLMSEDGQRLKRVCELINSEFIKSGLVADEKRPLKLHCTLLNTTFRRPRVNGPRIPFSYRDIQDCLTIKNIEGSTTSTAVTQAARTTQRKSQILAIPVDFGIHEISEIQICQMGSWGPEGEYVCVGKIDL